MATGIVSVALHTAGARVLSAVLLCLTAVVWIALALAFLARLRYDRVRWAREAAALPALTGVAGTAVLGSRLVLAGWQWAGWVLLALATPLCAVLLLRCRRAQLGSGEGFLLVVAPQSLVVLAAALHHMWLPALCVWAAALAVYCLVVVRFDLRELGHALGAHWIVGGALAISVLAVAELARAHHATVWKDASAALWYAALLPLALLVVAEALRPRLRYERERWSTVFPLGMYAAAGYAVAQAGALRWPADFARVWVWLTFAAWLASAVGTLRRGY
jgi:hypothetical protein